MKTKLKLIPLLSLIIFMIGCDNVDDVQVEVDGETFVVVTATPSIPPTQLASFSWKWIDGDFVGDVLPKPIRSRTKYQTGTFAGGMSLNNLSDVAFWDGSGSANWNMSGSPRSRLLIIDRGLLNYQLKPRFTASLGEGDVIYSWPTGEPWLIVKPGSMDVRVNINASPSTVWSVSITDIDE